MLAPFHQELLSFLQEQANQKIKEEGFDLQSDPQLSSFLKGLKSVEKEATFSLDEILEKYQYLFTSRGSLHVEKVLMQAFSKEEFASLNMERYYPKIYRGLPRLYQKKVPTRSQIKKPFQKLCVLKRQAMTKALYSTYKEYKKPGKVTIFTWVMNDGMGDYIAAIEVLRLLKGRLPNLEIQFIGLIQKKRLEGLKLPENAHVIPYETHCSCEDISDEIRRKLRESDLILQVPTYFPEFAKLIEEIKQIQAPNAFPKVESIGEYGCLESDLYHPDSGRYAMGLHFLEKGVLIRKPLSASWDDIENKEISRAIFKDNRFYLAYLSSYVGGAIYLHSLLKSLEFDGKNIDICTPDLGWFLEFVERQQKANRPLLEWDLGVESIEVLYLGQTYTMSVSSKGKKLRLICPEKISQSDFRALLALSGNWVGVRGDQSFSEAVSQGKAFFYDGKVHARYFVKDLVALAENRIANYPKSLDCIRGMGSAVLYQIPSQESEWVDESYFCEIEPWTTTALMLGMSLQEEETVEGLNKLNQIIREEFSANGFFCHLVQRALCHQAFSNIAEKEEENLKKFCHGEKTFYEVIDEQKNLFI